MKGTMKPMIPLKFQLAASVGLAAWLTGGVATVASQTVGGDQITAREIVGKSREAYASLSSYSDSGTVVSEMAGQKNTLTFNTRLQRPNLYRVNWTQASGPKGMAWGDGSGSYLLTPTAGQEKTVKARQIESMKMALARATGPSWSAASTIPGAFFNQDLGDVFVAPAVSGNYPINREQDAKLRGVDCYVVTSLIDLSKLAGRPKPGTASIMVWIGKKDFLIHQSRTTYVEKVNASAAPNDQEIDQAIKKSLEMQNKPATPEAIAAMRPQMRAIMKQVQSTLKSGFESGVVFTQTHEKIVVNEKFSPADFTHSDP